jgi:uncharacterized membrane protein YdjX (TVP38/TMEM64 family)
MPANSPGRKRGAGPSRAHTLRLGAGAAAIVLALIVSAVSTPLPDQAQIHDWVSAAGAAAPLAYLAVYTVGALALMPRPLLSAAAGLLFGPILGTVLAVLGATAAALFGFLFARSVGRGLAVGRLRRGKLARLDALLERRGWLAVLQLRLLPVVPFAVVNYGLGLTSVRTVHFVAGTIAGSLPATALVVAAGSWLISPTSPAFYIPLMMSLLVWLVVAVVARRLTPVRPSGADHCRARAD